MPLHADDHAHRRRHADRRRSAHAQTSDRFPNFFNGSAIAIFELRRQKRLVEQPNVAGQIADPLHRARQRLHFID